MSARHLLRLTATGAKKLGASGDARLFTGYVTDFVLDRLRPEYVSLMVTEDQSWEAFVAAAGLSREEAESLREALKNDKAVMAQKEQLNQKIFLQDFPQVKREVEGRIRRLRALADQVSQVHKDCTVSHVVADSTGVISGIMGFAGLFLAPCTGGISLGLCAGGAVLGAASSVTSAATSIVDGNSMSSAKSEAMELLSISTGRLNELLGMAAALSLKVGLAVDEFAQCVKELGKHVRAFKQARANPQVLHQAKRLMNSWRSARGFEDVERAFGGTALAMTRGARIFWAVPTSIFLGMDLTSLYQDSEHLSKGAESDLATELRRVAQELESKLELLANIHRKLSSG